MNAGMNAGMVAGRSWFYGHDGGNRALKGVAILDGKVYGSKLMSNMSVPGTIGKQIRGSETSFRENDRASKIISPFDTGEYILDFRGRSTYHGQLAEDSKEATTRSGDVSRYWSEWNLRSLLVCSASIIFEEAYTLFVVTHMPVKYATKEHKNKVIQALSGRHEFWLNGKHRVATVYVTKVVVEGVGALIAYGDEDENARQYVINIGSLTTDCLATIGQDTRKEYCDGAALGVSRMAELINQQVAEATGGYEFPSYDMELILQASLSQEPLYKHKGLPRWYPPLHYRGQLFDDTQMARWVTTARGFAGDEIKGFVSNLWRDSRGEVASDAACALLDGGGALHFREVIKEIIPGIIIPEDPALAEARGCALLADALGEQRFPLLISA